MARILLLASVVALAAACGGAASAQGPSPAPTAADCEAVVHARLLPCLTYVQPGSNLTRPEKGCCRGLSSAVQDHARCLCAFLSGQVDAGISVDRNKALLLPTVCNTMAPPPSLCPFLGAHHRSPVGSPAAAAASAGSASTPDVADPPADEPPAAAVPRTGSDAYSSPRRSSTLALLAATSFAIAAAL